MDLLEPCDHQPLLQDRDSQVGSPLNGIDRPEPEDGLHLAVGVLGRLGDPQGLLADGRALGELATLRQGPGKPGARPDRRKGCHAEALKNEVALEGANGLAE